VGQKSLKIHKTLQEVVMWVHPEGLVHGALYVSVDKQAQPVEDPHTVLNNDWPFLVLRRRDPDEIRFYNRGSIIRVEYDQARPKAPSSITLPCRITLMDGAVFEGEINEVLPPERARLYDYLNQATDRFLRLYLADDRVCLLNKSYIIQVTP
jgi:hypothetical protein